MWIWMMLACGGSPDADGNSLAITNDAHPFVIHREMRAGPARPTATGSHSDHFEIGRFVKPSESPREPKDAPIWVSIKMPKPADGGSAWRSELNKLSWTTSGDGFSAILRGDNGETFNLSCKAPWVADCSAVAAEFSVEFPALPSPTAGL